MSDQAERAGDGIHINHYCEHSGCKKWGSLGFARIKTDKIIWHCAEHYPHWQGRDPK